MALQDAEGFEADVTILAGRGWVLTDAPTITTAQKHQTISGNGGGKSMVFADAADALRIPIASPGTKDVCLAVRLSTGSGLNIDFDTALSTNCRVRLDTDGLVRLYRGAGSTLLATSGAALAADTWYWLKIAITAREAASSGRIQVFLNGSTSALVDTGAGVDCRATSTDDFDTIFLDSLNANDLWFDDYCLFSLGSAPNKQLYIKLKRPNAEFGTPDGTPSTGTDNSATIDEDPVSTADYNELVGSGDQDLFGYPALGYTPLEVVGVVTLMHATSEGTITQGRGIVESNGSTASGTNAALSTGGTYAVKADVFLTNPDGAIAWTAASVDAAHFGYEVS